MPDISFSSFNPRSFEQFAQALAGRVLGPGLLVFGDGPDGGREASFKRPLTLGCLPRALDASVHRGVAGSAMRPKNSTAPLARSGRVARKGRSTTISGTAGSTRPPVTTMVTAVAADASVPSSSTRRNVACATSSIASGAPSTKPLKSALLWSNAPVEARLEPGQDYPHLALGQRRQVKRVRAALLAGEEVHGPELLQDGWMRTASTSHDGQNRIPRTTGGAARHVASDPQRASILSTFGVCGTPPSRPPPTWAIQSRSGLDGPPMAPRPSTIMLSARP